MRFLKKLVCKIFGIQQCKCPPKVEPVKNSWGINRNIKKDYWDNIGHCTKHNSYKFSCIDCNLAIRKK